MNILKGLHNCEKNINEKELLINSLKKELKCQSDAIISLESQCHYFKSALDSVNSELAEKTKQVMEYDSKTEDLSKNLAKNEQILKNIEDKNHQLQSLVKKNESERKLLVDRFEAAQQMITNLRVQLNTNQLKLQKSEDQLADLEVQNSKLLSDLKNFKFKNSC